MLDTTIKLAICQYAYELILYMRPKKSEVGRKSYAQIFNYPYKTY
jgi:hypothetical protein